MVTLHLVGGPAPRRLTRPGLRLPPTWTQLVNRGTAEAPDVVRVDHELVASFTDEKGIDGLYRPRQIIRTIKSQTDPPPICLYA